MAFSRDFQLLVVEDDVLIARCLARGLRQRSVPYTLASSCAAALDLGRAFDAAILDLELPDGNGIDLAERLLAEGQLTGVVFFTATANPRLLTRAAELGRVVDKCAGLDELLSAVRQVVPGPASELRALSPRSRVASSG